MIPFAYIIDDDEILQIIIKTKLKKLSIVDKMEVYSDAKEALGTLEKFYENVETMPNVILLDLNMPGYDGFDFLNDFDKVSKNWMEKPKIYILTSSVSERDIQLTSSFESVSGFFVKPLNDRDIKKMVAQYSEI